MVPMAREHLALLMEAGYICLGMQRFKEAKEIFEGVAALKPESEIPLVALAGISFCRGKLKEAIQTYQKALKMNPESLYAKAYLGEAFFFDGQKQEAVRLLKEVGQLETKGPTGDFARALLDALEKGFTPETLSQVKELKEHYEKKKP